MRLFRPIFLILVFYFGANGPLAASQGPVAITADDLVEIDRLFDEALNTRALPGASVTITYDDGRSVTRNYGVMSSTSQEPVTDPTRFRIGSISKMLTALAIMDLVEDGALKLDTPVASFFPDRDVLGKLPGSVTIEHLLRHTSGLADYNEADLHAKVTSGLVTDADLESVLARPTVFEAGHDWAYSNAGYRLLSRILEIASEQTYEEYVRRVLAPSLGLSSLRLCDPGDSGQATGYVSRDGQLQPERAYSIRGLLGEGGLCVTSADLAHLPRKLKTGDWILETTLTRMLAPARLKDGAEIDYGLGVRGGYIGRSRAWGHTGGGPDGSWASMAHYPAHGVTIAVLANGTGSGTDAATLQAAVAAIILDSGAPEDVAVDRSVLEPLTGQYVQGEDAVCMVIADGKLVRHRGSSGAVTPLLPQGSNIFARSDFLNDRFVFQTDGGRALGYRVYQDGLFVGFWRRTPDEACS